MIHCNSDGRITKGSHFKHCKPHVFSAYSNQKFLCEWLCIMTDQISGFLHQKYDWKFILQFLLLTCNLYSCMLTCLTVYKMLSLFLVCSLRIYINEMLLGRSIPRSSQPLVTSVLSESIGFSMYPFFEFGVVYFCVRCTLGFWFPKKYAHQNEPLNQGNLHELR